MPRKVQVSTEPKKRGRPRKQFSKDSAKDAELHKPHDCWDFTDYVVPYQPVMKYSDAGELNAAAQIRMDFWTGLGDSLKTLEIAHEICPDTQRPHGQGRVRFTRKIRFEALKKILPPDVHFEPSACQICDMYLRKHDSVALVNIDNRHQGKRVVFSEQLQAIKDGATLNVCIDMEGANYQSIRAAEITLYHKEPLRPVAPRETILIESIDEVPFDAFRLPNKYWDGYDAHPVIYINQAKLGFTMIELSEITGRQPFRLGGRNNRSARHNTIYIFGMSELEYSRLIDI
ncbi:MAG: putative replication-associated protein [Cressdnaviricota sp.]|nr:MAG: putative replication-associated protein [Cressdnaviricota sp.]